MPHSTHNQALWTRAANTYFPIRSLVLWTVSFIIGLVISQRTGQTSGLYILLGFVSSLNALSCHLLDRKFFLLWLLLATSFAGAGLHTQQKPAPFPWPALKKAEVIGQKYWFEGKIEQLQLPRRLKTAKGTIIIQRATVQLWSWQKTQQKPPCKTLHKIRLSIYTKRTKNTTKTASSVFSPLLPGQRIRFRSRLRIPRRFANRKLRDNWFLLAKQRITLEGSTHRFELVVLGFSEASFWALYWYKTRDRLTHWISKELGTSAATGLLQALLVGYRGGVSPEDKRSFSKTGTSHLLAISGLHLSLVASLAFVLAGLAFPLFPILTRWISKQKWSALLTLPSAAGYMFLSGASVSTQRAFCMIVVYLLTILFERTNEGTNTLALAALIILVIEPHALFSLSFQLSFVAVLALLCGASLLSLKKSNEDSGHWLLSFLSKGIRWMGILMLTSLIATLATLPFTLQFFPNIPWLGPFINIIAVPLGGYLVVGMGMLAVCVYVIHPDLAGTLLQWSAFFGEQLLDFVNWSAGLSWGSFTGRPLSILQTIAYYLFWIGLLLCFKKYRKFWIIWVLSVFLLLGSQVGEKCQKLWKSQKKYLTLRVLDIGQGDAILIRFPNGKRMLVDAGGEAFVPFDVGERVLLPYFRQHGIQALDFAVLSHPHPDHFGGFISLLGAVSVGEFWHTAEKGGHPHHKKLLKVLKQRKVKTKHFTRPFQKDIGGVQVKVLHPFPGPYEGKTYYWGLHANDNSLVILLRYGKINILLSGDIEERAEEILCKRYKNLRVDLLKVPHHGSRTSSTARLLDHIRPKHAVVSLGRSNLFGFPHKEVLRRYRQRQIPLWRTDLHGEIEIRTDGKSLQFKPFLNVPGGMSMKKSQKKTNSP